MYISDPLRQALVIYLAERHPTERIVGYSISLAAQYCYTTQYSYESGSTSGNLMRKGMTQARGGGARTRRALRRMMTMPCSRGGNDLVTKFVRPNFFGHIHTTQLAMTPSRPRFLLLILREAVFPKLHFSVLPSTLRKVIVI